MIFDKKIIAIAKELCTEDDKNPNELVDGCYGYTNADGTACYVFDDFERSGKSDGKFAYADTKVFQWREYYDLAEYIYKIANGEVEAI